MDTGPEFVQKQGVLLLKDSHFSGGQQSGKSSSFSDNRTCSNCGKKGHFAKHCKRPKSGAAHSAEAEEESSGDYGFAFTATGPLIKPSYERCVGGPKCTNLRAGAAMVQTDTVYDREDFMLEPELFRELFAEIGDFTLDDCADNDGNNAQIPVFCCKENSFLDNDHVTGEKIWLNPHFRRAGAFLHHYLDQKEKAPTTTSCLVILPYKPEATWWPLVQNWQQVRYWREDTQLFTLPGKHGQQRRLRPCHFPVVALCNPPIPATAQSNFSSVTKEDLPSFVLDS